MAGKSWNDEELTALEHLYGHGYTDEEIGQQIGRTGASVHNRLQALKRDGKLADRRDSIKRAAFHPPVSAGGYEQLSARVRELEAENAALREQKKWETHSDNQGITGGLMTLRDSDRHHGDENHLLSCAAQLEEKFCVLLNIYKPDRIQYIGFDDWIAGRGIFKEQDLQCAVSDPLQQIQVGAIKARRFFQKVRAVTEAPIHVVWLKGNHEYAGALSLSEYLHDKTCLVCKDIPNITWQEPVDRALVNLASEGHHNMLAFHGWGHSKNSPNSPGFIDAAKDAMLLVQRKLPPEQHIRRVASGHTHWFDRGTERIPGISFDTTGGLQRNNRVKLGFNQRPIGWLVYVSPSGSNDILQPIGLTPDIDTYEREMSDAHLAAANKEDCAVALSEYRQLLRDRGLLTDSDPIGVTEGRW